MTFVDDNRKNDEPTNKGLVVNLNAKALGVFEKARHRLVINTTFMGCLKVGNIWSRKIF